MPTDNGDGDDQPMSRPADQAGSAGPITRRVLFGIFLKAGLAFGGGLGILAVLEQPSPSTRPPSRRWVSIGAARPRSARSSSSPTPTTWCSPGQTDGPCIPT
jgi:hypothetical protein